MSTEDRTPPVEYRQIPECPGYEFGSDATAWSQWNSGRGVGLGEWSCMSPTRQPTGIYHLRVKINGQRTFVRLHEMICWAFHGKRPDGMECLFRDGDRSNLHPDNLYWGTAPENVMDPAAEYRSIPECVGYLFGSDGSVWSEWGSGAASTTGIWKRLALTPNPSGHLSVRVQWNEGRRQTGVHYLICWAFNGPCPPGLECCHKDGIPDNNRPDNLYWGTRAQNIADQERHGVRQRGSRSGLAKLDERRVAIFLTLHAFNPVRYGQRALARIFGISSGASGQIIRGETWKHVARPTAKAGELNGDVRAALSWLESIVDVA